MGEEEESSEGHPCGPQSGERGFLAALPPRGGLGFFFLHNGGPPVVKVEVDCKDGPYGRSKVIGGEPHKDRVEGSIPRPHCQQHEVAQEMRVDVAVPAEGTIWLLSQTAAICER